MQPTSLYDLRGEKALSDKSSYSLPQSILTPYEYARTLVPQVFPGGKKFLDLCCGIGIHSLWALTKGYEVVGVDLSAKSIEAARKVFSEKVEPQSVPAEFHLGDALEFLSRGSQYEVIFMSGSLYYFQLNEIVPKVLSSLKTGGSFICVETFADNPFMALYRKIRYGLWKKRDRASVENLMGSVEIKKLENFFVKSSTKYFDFTTLATGLLPERLAGGTVLRLARRTDNFLLNSLNLRGLSYKFVFHGVKL
ncbi:MAG: methyltransferase domain-containing protein [Pseudomonadota bacterium]|nr:methyltransferase domain-containing protein [Pseudomonadota bacterium]